MAEGKRRYDQAFGHLDSLEYFPRQDHQSGPGTLKVGKLLFDNPSFQLLCPFETVTPAPQLAEVEDGRPKRQERRIHQRWLMNARPEASWAPDLISDVVKEEAEFLKGEEHKPPAKPLIAFGEITDAKLPSDDIKGAPALAMSAGENGQILRILRLTEEAWQWSRYDDVLLNVWKMIPSSREDEVFWARDVTPISRIKFATDLQTHSPCRWLIVQKRMSTTILKPTYHSVPVPVDGAALPDLSASRVEPVEVLTLGTDRTGGNAHADVAFNPRRHTLPPQVAIIDECGCWSVWNVSGKLTVASTVFRASLFRCGRIGAEPLPSLVGKPLGPVQSSYGLLWCSPLPEETYDWDDEEGAPKAESGITAKLKPPRRSHTLVLWNQAAVVVVEAEDGVACSTIPIITKRRSAEAILDVKPNIADPSQILVLTTRALHWVDVCPFGEDVRDVPPSIMKSFLHQYASTARIELITSYEVDPNGKVNGLAFLYEQDTGRLAIFWLLDVADDSSSRQFHHQLQYIETRRGDGIDNLHQLLVMPLRLRPRTTEALDGGPGTRCRESGAQFYQIVKFGRRLSLDFTISGIARGIWEKLRVPSRAPDSAPDLREQHSRLRSIYIGYMSDKFVIPSKMGGWESLVTGAPAVHEGPLEFKPLPEFKVVILRRTPRREAVRVTGLDSKRPGMLFSGALERLRQCLVEGVEPESLPLKILPEFKDGTQRHGKAQDKRHMDLDDVGWTRELGQILESNVDVLAEGIRLRPDGAAGVEDLDEEYLALQRELSGIWSPTHDDSSLLPQASRRVAMVKATCRDALLASYSVRTIPISSTQEEKLPVRSSSPFLLGSEGDIPLSSHDVRRKEEAEKRQSSAQVLRRINQLVAQPTSTRKTLSGKTHHSVASRWDDVLGDSYIPFVGQQAAEIQARLMARKARIEERRERVKQTNEEFRRRMGWSTVHASQPAASTGHSMPIRPRPTMSSSQPSTQLPVSQPTSGLFAQRRPVKRRKVNAFGSMF